MTLRLRLLVIIGLSLLLLWSAASVWMLLDLRQEFRSALDERLAASANMVAGLIAELPSPSTSSPPAPNAALEQMSRDDVACEIRLLRGDVVARTGNSPRELGATPTGYATRTIDGVQWRSYTLQHGGVRVTTADKVERRQALLRDVVVATAVPFLVAAIGSLLALWLGVGRGLAPLSAIRKALAERQPDALQPVPDARVPNELAPLISTINGLLERVNDAIQRERSFTGAAAHELRTPLTAIKTHIEVARLAGTGRESATALDRAGAGVLRLQRTLDQLLMLARLEGRFSFDSGEWANARAVAEGALNDIAPELQQRIALEDSSDQRIVAVPLILAVTALRNLLDNALRYSAPPVALRVASTKDAVRFEVEDRGAGMSADDCARATERFWRKGPREGCGLGLAIVEVIVKRYNGGLQLLPGAQGGLIARLTLPVC